MKRILALAGSLTLAAATSFAAITSMTLDYSVLTPGFTANPSFGAYNWTTDHWVSCDFGTAANWQVRTVDGANGALIGTLAKGTINVGASTLGVFSICVADDGKIYGGVNALSDGSAGNSICTWLNEADASPTQQDPAAGGPNTVVTEFARAMDAVGSGVDTVIASTGGGAPDMKATFLTTADGTTFAVTDHTVVGEVVNTLKQSLALVPATPLDVIYGTQADGGYSLAKQIKTAGVWGADPNWAPPAAGNVTGTGTDPANCSAIGYVPGHDEVLVASTNAVSPATDRIYVLNGSTGAYTGVSLDLGQNIGTFGYGKIDVDETTGEGYITCRSDTALSPLYAKFSFDVYVPPVPTPFPTAADQAWGLYE